LDQHTDQSKSTLRMQWHGLDKLGIAMAAASAVAVAAIAKMTDSASNLAEEISKSSVIWGEQAAEIESFADRAAQALGISKQSALEATSTFQRLRHPNGVIGHGGGWVFDTDDPVGGGYGIVFQHLTRRGDPSSWIGV
jgi:hypothetical protein